jgi:hypothetical protein
MPKILSGGRRISLPPLLPGRKAYTRDEKQSQHCIVIGEDQLWVRFSSYTKELVEEEIVTNLFPDNPEKPVETAIIRYLAIRPERGARAEVFRFSNDLLDEAALFLANRFRFGEEKGEELYRALCADPPHYPEVFSIVEQIAEPIVDEYFRLFGPLGIRFDDIWSLVRLDSDNNIHVIGWQGEDLGTLEEYFGDYLSRPVSLKILSDNNLVPLFRAYREPLYDVYREALEFASWVRDFSSAKSANSGAVMEANRVLRRCVPRLEFEGPELQLDHSFSAPPTSVRLRAIYRRLGGKGFHVCRSEFCESLFPPTKPRQQYCTPDCSTYRRVRRFQERKRNGRTRSEEG